MITYDHRIDKILRQIEYGDHALLIYSDLNAFRQIYTRFCKMSLEERNETVLILTYYDAIGSIASIIMNATDIDVERNRRKGHLIIVDSVKEFFGSGKDFRSLIQFIERSILNNGRTGISIIADMNSFYHVGKMDGRTFYIHIPEAHQLVYSKDVNRGLLIINNKGCIFCLDYMLTVICIAGYSYLYRLYRKELAL